MADVGGSAGRRAKVTEWVRRYLPAEIAATIGEFGGAGLAYAVTGSFAAAAVVGTIGASVGYYCVSLWRGALAYYRLDRVRRGPGKTTVAVAMALRSIALEFGPAEVIDTLLVRPLSWYVGLSVVGNTLTGWVAAKIVADVGFYACAIMSYEVNKPRLAPTLSDTGHLDEDTDDAATSGEVDLRHGLGVDIARVIHTHPVKKAAAIDLAHRVR